MKNIFRIFLLCTAILFTSHSVAQEEPESKKQAILFPSFYFSSDNEGFTTYKYQIGYLPLYEHGDNYTGVMIQQQYFTQDDWKSSGQQYTLMTRAINPRNALGYNLNIGYNVENGHQLITTDSSYGFQVTDTTRAEVMAARNRLETQGSLDSGTYYTLGGASIEQQLFKGLTAIAMGANMYISDSNTRPIFKAKLIYDLLPAYGITAQLRYRQFRSTNINVTRDYFNPEKYNETMIAIGFRKRIEGWVVSGTIGLGRQSVNNETQTGTQLYELAVTSPVASNGFYLKARAGYGNSAGILGENYFYRYVMADFIFPF